MAADAALRLAARLLARKRNRLQIRQAFVTAENVNGLIEEGGFGGELGVLSIDVDGVDYWLWKAIRVVSPRVVVIEYNASFGATRAVTVPYKPDFRCHPGGLYHGASLAALSLLGRQLGYVLVAVESAGVNAFFVRQDLCPPALAGRSPADLYRPHLECSKTLSPEGQWAAVSVAAGDRDLTLHKRRPGAELRAGLWRGRTTSTKPRFSDIVVETPAPSRRGPGVINTGSLKPRGPAGQNLPPGFFLDSRPRYPALIATDLFRAWLGRPSRSQDPGVQWHPPRSNARRCAGSRRRRRARRSISRSQQCIFRMTWQFLSPDSAHRGPKPKAVEPNVGTEACASRDVQVLPSGRQEVPRTKRHADESSSVFGNGPQSAHASVCA